MVRHPHPTHACEKAHQPSAPFLVTTVTLRYAKIMRRTRRAINSSQLRRPSICS